MSLKKIAVFISGSGSNLQALIDKVHNRDGEIALVISDEEDAYGLTRARKANIKTSVIKSKDYPLREDFCNALKEEVEKNKIDLIVLAGFMKILTPSFARAFPNRIINVHPALIPSFCGKGYYGLRVHEKALEYGVKVSGATVHFADEGADTGPIILQGVVEVKDDDTPKVLQLRIMEVEHEILPKAVSLFCKDKLVVENRKVKILK